MASLQGAWVQNNGSHVNVFKASCLQGCGKTGEDLWLRLLLCTATAENDQAFNAIYI